MLCWEQCSGGKSNQWSLEDGKKNGSVKDSFCDAFGGPPVG